MAKVTYTSLKLKTVNTVQTIKIGDTDIEVLQYLPIDDKYDLINITLQNAEENGYYNPLKIDMFFHLFLIFMYTNITFTDKQKEDLSKLYDVLESNGIITNIITAIPENEYNQLVTFLNETIEKRVESNKSILGSISKFFNSLPEQAEAMQEIMDNFDTSKFQEVINFAKAANGGRDIN